MTKTEIGVSVGGAVFVLLWLFFWLKNLIAGTYKPVDPPPRD